VGPDVSTIRPPVALDQQGSRTSALTVLLWWAIAWLITASIYPFSNDHFGRISAARQIARYGELPFRDFLDPGYVLTELVSAGMQRLLGDNLLGEILWTSSCIATGAVLVILLARRVTPSRVSAVLIGLIVILAAPRPYDFDKFLFYPLGILLCWRYVDFPSVRRLWMLGAWAVVAGMFRYDNGLFVLAAGITTLVTLHARDVRMLGRQLGLLVVASFVSAIPHLPFLQMTGGVINAAGQMVTYAQREGLRTRLTGVPAPLPPAVHIVHNPDRVQVRWAADADRSRLEAQYTLHDGVAKGDPASRVWLYEIDDESRKNLRALIDDPRVADTHLVDRSKAVLTPEEPRPLPLAITWMPRDAANALYWVFLLVPAAAVVIVWGTRSDASERARVTGTAAMAACVIALVLREPLVARLSGAAAPTIVLGAWVWSRVRRNWLTRLVGVTVIVTAAVVSDWNSTLSRLSANLPTFYTRAAQAAVSPPPASFLPAPVSGVIGYVRRCTRPEDRIFAGWFVPELYFFSQRAFAGGVAAMFGHHWSETANQRRIITKMNSESVPLVILPTESNDFQDTYLDLNEYFRTHFHSIGRSTFGRADAPSYVVLARNDRAPTGTDPVSSLPCFH
jgi:hypothetical protein